MTSALPTPAPNTDRIRRTTAALINACHPLPTVAVTLLATGLLLKAGTTPGRAVLFIATILTGQLFIGWSNDRIDAVRDRAVARAGKPVAAGELSLRVIDLAAGAALVATVALSVGLGWPAGAVAFCIVICGWLYNVGAKATIWSWLPYAVAFGLLPAAATLAGTSARWPAWWALAAGAAIGVAAHFANVLPDLAADAATGVRGLPQAMGARPSALAAVLLLCLASALVALGPGHPGVVSWVGLVIAIGLTVGAGALAWRNPVTRWFFLAVIGITIVDVVLFAASGAQLS